MWSSTLVDDIVFPISEGLARRFVRIELRGAALDEVLDYLDYEGAGRANERYHAAAQLVADLFSACESEGKLGESELGDHLPFGVGYFGLLRCWVASQLPMSREFSERELFEQALEVLTTALRSATRDKAYDAIFSELGSRGVTA